MKPNIIYLHSHDTGRSIAPYGWAIPTPNLQKLAEQGTLFHQAFCVSPTCSPSRAALLMGDYPHQNGVCGLANRGFSIPDYSAHVAHALRGGGYRSYLAGFQHIAADAEDIGYDEVLRFNAFAPNLGPAVANWLSDAPDEPFFLDVGFNETHRGGGWRDDADVPADARYAPTPPGMPPLPVFRQQMADFSQSAQRLDDAIGLILESLERSGLSENTLVVYTTDHGLAFPRGKSNLTENGLGVALIVRGPGIGQGEVCDAIVSHLDLYPTWCEIAGVETPQHCQGRSLWPLLRGETASLHDALFAEMSFHGTYEPARSTRTERYRYTRQFLDRTHPLAGNTDPSPAKTFFVENGWLNQQVAREQLFDLWLDPAQAHDLSADTAHASTLHDLRARLQSWMERTNDPLLNGPMVPPIGALLGDADGRTFYEVKEHLTSRWR